MRGKPDLIGAGGPRGRIIPAHAGQTPTAVRFPLFPPDHPRACGANPIFSACRWTHFGSSPRMRGKPVRCVVDIVVLRIIPAHAGQTPCDERERRSRTDHPRACGANSWTFGSRSSMYGSSPRMRGKPRPVQSTGAPVRIIPAHAGQTTINLLNWVPKTDHPRACGANSSSTSLVKPLFGSSPRMRGKQSDFMRKLLSAGPSIIGFAQWLQSSYYCSCLQSSAKTPISRGTTPTSLFLGFQNSITLLLLT